MRIRWLVVVAALSGGAAGTGAQDGERADRVVSSARLAQRMQEHRVPAVSIAVIEGAQIAWTRALGPVDPDTIFQAASISKPVAATAALHMSQYGNFTLDEDVNGKLSSWKIPANDLTEGADVTLRGLLSHSAGLTVHGFPGYRDGTPLPSLLQILNGEPPANSGPIRVTSRPGTAWRYSGGGYVVLQQLMTDRIGWSFPELMRRMVLERLRMVRSTYQQPLPVALAANAAAAHDADGRLIPGRWHVYPEMAAAGLWTTPRDLALWAMEIRDAYHGRSNRLIERSTAHAMLSRQKGDYGLGVRLEGDGPSLRFGHGGSNAGYRATLTMLVESGQGAVIMTNGENGGELFDPLLRAIAGEYGWPTP